MLNTNSTDRAVFNKLLNIANDIDYNPGWKNGEGLLIGAMQVSAPAGVYKCVDENRRNVVIVGPTHDQMIVIHDRPDDLIIIAPGITDGEVFNWSLSGETMRQYMFHVIESFAITA